MMRAIGAIFISILIIVGFVMLIDKKPTIFIDRQQTPHDENGKPLEKPRKICLEMGTKCGFADLDGNIIFEPKYQNVMDFSNGFAAYEDDEKWGFINAHGRVIIAPRFEAVGSFDDENLAPVKSSNSTLWGVINEVGEFVIEPRFEDLRSFNAFNVAIAAVKSNDGLKYGLINRKGAWVAPPHFANITDFDDNGVAVAFEGSGGYIDMEGKVKMAHNITRHGYIDARGRWLILIEEARDRAFVKNKRGEMIYERIL